MHHLLQQRYLLRARGEGIQGKASTPPRARLCLSTSVCVHVCVRAYRMRSIYASIPSLPTSPGVRRIPGLSTAAVLPHPLPPALEAAFALRAADEPPPCPLLPGPVAFALAAAEFGTARMQPRVSSPAPKP